MVISPFEALALNANLRFVRINGPKYAVSSEHKRQTCLVRSSPPGAVSGRRKSPELNAAGPRVVQISVTDADATDSSSDEEDGMFRRQRVLTTTEEVIIGFLLLKLYYN